MGRISRRAYSSAATDWIGGRGRHRGALKRNLDVVEDELELQRWDHSLAGHVAVREKSGRGDFPIQLFDWSLPPKLL
jgi:hypothetical protein